MDMSFALRSRRTFASSTPDLHALLSTAAARQAMTPAARAHWQRSLSQDSCADPRVALFCGLQNPFGAVSGRFADLGTSAVNCRQSS
jgi:hypothetical protein